MSQGDGGGNVPGNFAEYEQSRGKGTSTTGDTDTSQPGDNDANPFGWFADIINPDNWTEDNTPQEPGVVQAENGSWSSTDGVGGHGDQDAARAEEAARRAREQEEAARLAAEQARKEEEAAARARAEEQRKKEERARAERARQVAADERARARRISAMKNGQTSSILTSPQGVLNPVFTTSSNLWGLQPKFKKKLLGE